MGCAPSKADRAVATPEPPRQSQGSLSPPSPTKVKVQASPTVIDPVTEEQGATQIVLEDDLGTAVKEADQAVKTARLQMTSHVGIPESTDKVATPYEDGLACSDEMKSGREGDLNSADPVSEGNGSDGSDLSVVESGMAEVTGTASMDPSGDSPKCPQKLADGEQGMHSAQLEGRTASPVHVKQHPQTEERAPEPSFSAVNEGCNAEEVESERDDVRTDKNSETDEEDVTLSASNTLENNSDGKATAEGSNQVTLVAQNGGSCCYDDESRRKGKVEDSCRGTADKEVGSDAQANLTVLQEPPDNESRPVLTSTLQPDEVCWISGKSETASTATSAPSAVQSQSMDIVHEAALDTLVDHSIDPEMEDMTRGRLHSIKGTSSGPTDGMYEGASAFEDTEKREEMEETEGIECCSPVEASQVASDSADFQLNDAHQKVETTSTEAIAVADAGAALEQTEKSRCRHDEATVSIPQLEEAGEENFGEDPCIAGPIDNSCTRVQPLHEPSAPASGHRDSACLSSDVTDDSEQHQKPIVVTASSQDATSQPLESAGDNFETDMEPCVPAPGSREGVIAPSEDAVDDDEPLQETTLAPVLSSQEGNSIPLGDAGIPNHGQQEPSMAASDSHNANSDPLDEVGDRDEPLLVLQNVTSISRAVIPEEQLQHKSSAVDRWGWSTKISKVKSSALGTLKADDEPGVAIPAPKVKSPTPTSVVTKGSKKAASSATVVPTTAPTTEPPAAPARVSKELTDIERARLFAASVLAETEKRERPNSTADSANKGSGTSWWRQKMEALQAEL